MFRNHLKIALRNLQRRKLISAINIIGLSLGVAVSLLLGVYANDIMTYDQFHEGHEDIYFLHRTRATPDGAQVPVGDTWGPLVDEIKASMPNVENGTHYAGGGATLTYNNNDFDQSVMFTDQSFFEVFSFPVDKGNEESFFAEPNSIVLSQEVANSIFGDEDPIGKVVELDLGEGAQYTITGVLGEIPFNSSITFDIIVNLESMKPRWTERGFYSWRASFMLSFLRLRPGQNPDDLSTQFQQLVEKFVPEQERGTLQLMPLRDYYDYNTRQQQYGYILFYISLGILFIAIVNFTNLNAAQSLVRFKEVGIRKVFGAGRKSLVNQFIGESMLTSSLSFVLGIGLAFLMLPQFVSLFEQQISLDFLIRLENLPFVLLFIFLMGFVSGIYPSLILSKLQPVAIFQDSVSTGKKGFDPKNLLIVLQFSIAIMLISAVMLMYQQISFMKGANMNFDPENLVSLSASSGNFSNAEEGESRIRALQNSIEALSGVTAVSASNTAPGRYPGSMILVQSDDARDQPPLDWRFVFVDHNYFPIMNMDFVSGRNFDADMATDEGLKAIVNEAAIRQLGWSSIEERRLVFPGREDDEGIEVIGVVRDFNYQSLARGIEPVIHLFAGRTNRRYSQLLVKLTSQNIRNTLQEMEAIWADFDQSSPFEYSFIDEEFERLYETEERVASMISYATGLAILVAVLGILGLASFSVVQRMKEVAIRKVLGASSRQILQLLVKRFTIILVISLLIAVPVNYYFMSDWLDSFAFRIDVNLLVYFFSGLTVLAVSWVVLGAYSMKAIRSNPVKTLRHQ